MKAILTNLAIDPNWTSTRNEAQHVPSLFMNMVSSYAIYPSVIITKRNELYRTYSIRDLLP